MSHAIVQAKFTFGGSRSGYEATTLPMAGQLAGIPGLVWKVWLMNEASREAGGIYLFGNADAAQGFAQQLEAMLHGDPSFGDVSIQQFDVLEAHSIITRGLPKRPHTFGDMNGFFLIRGDNAQLDTLTASEAWVMHMLRAGLHMEGAGVVRGATGDLVMERMSQWVQSIP
jgi:hypothetical protein